MKQSLEPTFVHKYFNLLQAIEEQNYEKIELLCDEALTEAIGAKIYELGHLEGFKFNYLDKKSKQQSEKKSGSANKDLKT